MTRAVDTDDLLAAYSGGDVDAVRRVLEAFLSGDTEEPIKGHVQIFIRKSIKKIVENIEAGKKPNADRAFGLKRENRRPANTSVGNHDIAVDVQKLRDAGEKKSYAIAVVSDKYCLSTESIERIYKKEKAHAVQALKLSREAEQCEAWILVETLWRDGLSEDELLLEVILRHERSLLGKPRLFLETSR